MTPTEYLEEIDKKFESAKARKISRFDIEWGKWSRAMNLETRERISLGGPETEALKNVFAYWVLSSQLLESHFKGFSPMRFFRQKQIEVERKTVKEAITTGKPIAYDEKDLIMMATKP